MKKDYLEVIQLNHPFWNCGVCKKSGLIIHTKERIFCIHNNRDAVTICNDCCDDDESKAKEMGEVLLSVKKL